MPTILKIIIAVIMIAIIVLIGYILYLYKKEGEAAKNKEKTIKTKINTPERNKVQDWQKDLILIIIRERLARLQKTKRLNPDELEVLSKMIEKEEELLDWDNLIDLTKNEKAYGVLNIAILDYLYTIISKKDKNEDIVKTIYLMDCVNGGVEMKKGEPDCLPVNLDINATLIKLLNSNLSNAEELNLSENTIKRACLELAANGGYKNLNWPATQVIARIILNNIGNTVYDIKNMTKLLSDENKIYIRLLASITGNIEYSEIVKKYSPIPETAEL